MKISVYFSIVFLLFSCSGNSAISNPIEDASSAIKDSISSNPKEENSNNSVKLSEPTPLLENKMHHAFSDNVSQDEFRLVITGESILKGKAVFTITNRALGEIYHDEFDAESLVGWGLDSIQNPTVKQLETYIQKRVTDFFKASHFSDPAIATDAEFDEEGFVDKSVWKEIKSDKDAIGFFYLIEKENGRDIAYSRKHKKGIVYSGCC